MNDFLVWITGGGFFECRRANCGCWLGGVMTFALPAILLLVPAIVLARRALTVSPG